MIKTVPLCSLGTIATISKGIWVKTAIAKSYSREELEKIYKLEVNDIVLRKDIYGTGKKIAVLVKDCSIAVIPNGASLVIHPDTNKVFPLYLKAFLEFLPSGKVLQELKIQNQKKLLSKGSLKKLKIPLPTLEEQFSLASEYDKVSSVYYLDRYRNPIIEQYNSLMKFFWSCYQTCQNGIIN